MGNNLKFRAFHKPTKRMFEVYGFNDDFVFEKTDNGVYVGDCNPAKREDCILLQCTGIKDKNGKLIYDGDIVKHYPCFAEPIYLIVSMINGCWRAYHLDGRPFNILSSVGGIEIIGNIHEKQEVLK